MDIHGLYIDSFSDFQCFNLFDYRDQKDYLFCVVEFEEQEEVAVIPKCWLRGSNFCMWPPYKSSNRLEKAVKNMEEADENIYTLFKVSRIMYKTDSYSKAFSKLKQAEMMSDLQTEEEEDTVVRERKRIRRPTIRYESDSSPEKQPRSSKNCMSSPEKTPSSKKVRRTLPSLPTLPPIPSPLPSTSSNGIQSSPAPSPRPCLQEMPSCSFVPSRPTSATEKKILTIMEEIKSQVNGNTKLLKMLESNEKTASAAIGELPAGMTMPIASTEQFENIEECLKNSENQKQLITCLGTIGGENVQECTRRIMKFIMTHAVSLQYTWKGSAEKKAFENTAVCNAVKCAVRKNKLTEHASDKDIGVIIGCWLRGAKDREGGRKQRMKKKTNETNEINEGNDNNDNNTEEH